MDGEKRLVKVYSNCKEMELFLNGESLGTKKRDAKIYPACGFFWNVQFRKGKNELIAKAKTKDVDIQDKIELVYQTEEWGKQQNSY